MRISKIEAALATLIAAATFVVANIIFNPQSENALMMFMNSRWPGKLLMSAGFVVGWLAIYRAMQTFRQVIEIVRAKR